MRGSVYYQTSQLAKQIFIEGAKKYEKSDTDHPYYKCVSSYKTMETYRRVWDNLGNYLKEHWKLNDFEQITAEHIDAYITYKIEYYTSKQYLEKIVSAIGKLQVALERFSINVHGTERIYDFDIRQNILHYARVQNLVADGYVNRVYVDPLSIIDKFEKYEHAVAAEIQLYGGARSEAVTLIKKEQMLGFQIDEITGKRKAGLLTKEKGGKEGIVLIPITTYLWLEDYMLNNNVNTFKISYQAYANEIREACKTLSVKAHGSHGFRWTFAQNRVREYQEHGYSYEQSLQGVSWEMKHFRASITEHYLGR